MSTEVRVVSDSMGELEIPKSALYGAQTQRAINNFPVSGQSMPREFVETLVLVKQVAARVNLELECIDTARAASINQACDDLLAMPDLMNHFPVDVFQTGSGTSSNMNANEVIANRAVEILGGERGNKSLVHPNDHVNMSQSSNDVIPTGVHLSASLTVHEILLPGLTSLLEAIENFSVMGVLNI